jgi:hypothetical protein
VCRKTYLLFAIGRHLAAADAADLGTAAFVPFRQEKSTQACDLSASFISSFLAPRPGLEPGTYGLTVRRSTD